MPMRIPKRQAETSLRRAFEMADDDTATLETARRGSVEV